MSSFDPWVLTEVGDSDYDGLDFSLPFDEYSSQIGHVPYDDSFEAWQQLGVDDPRVRVGGFYTRVLHRYQLVLPAVGWSAVEAVDVAAEEARDDILDELLAHHPDKQWAEKFRQRKKLVQVHKPTVTEGIGEVCPAKFAVEYRIPGLTSKPLLGYSDEPVGEPPAPFPDQKTYYLEQFFCDADVVDKYCLSPRFVQSIKRCAIEQPRNAALTLQRKLRSMGYTGVTVRAGYYQKSKNRACAAVHEAARKFPSIDNGAIAKVVDGKMFFYHDVHDVVQWMVMGPVVHAKEIVDVYNMNCHLGIEVPTQLLSYELQLLGICVYDARTESYVSGLVEAHVDVHGIQPEPPSVKRGVTPAQMSALLQYTDRVRPVYLEGKVVASSVRVTDKYLLTCEHIFNECADAEPDARLALGGPAGETGKRFTQVRPMGHDLWVLRCDEPMKDAWNIRNARVGESAVLLYSVGDRLEVSSAVTVHQADANDVAVTCPPEARKGVSGAALVSLSDFALLGVYRALTTRRAIASAFGQQRYSELADIEAESVRSLPVGTEMTSGDVWLRFKNRGYAAAMRSVRDALVPVCSRGDTVGVAAKFGDSLVTPCSPDAAPLRLHPVGPDGKFSSAGRGAVFTPLDNNRYYTDAQQGEAASPHSIRGPRYDERVVVVARDSTSVYFSGLATVYHIGAKASVFYISDCRTTGLPLCGGLVVSYEDASVLGQFVQFEVTSDGVRGLCVAAPDVAELAGGSRVSDWFSAKFPMVNPVAWVEQVERVLSVRQNLVERAKHSAYGQAALRIASLEAMEFRQVPVNLWHTQMREMHHVKAVDRACREQGLAEFIRLGPDESRLCSVKDTADVLFAVLGILWHHETWDTFKEVCLRFGLLGSSLTDLVSVEVDDKSDLSRPSSVVTATTSAELARMFSVMRANSPASGSLPVLGSGQADEFVSNGLSRTSSSASV